MECNFENCPNFERLGKKFADRISELEQENDRLKEEVRTEKIYSSQIEELEESIVGQRNAYKKLNSMYEENCEYTGKLEQTLQKIKAIATGVRSYLEVPAPRDVRYEMDRILDLITKVGEE